MWREVRPCATSPALLTTSQQQRPFNLSSQPRAPSDGAPLPGVSMALADLALVDIAFAPPTAHEIKEAADAWRAFQWRWLRTYGTRVVRASQLFALAEDLFEMNEDVGLDGRVAEFSRFLRSRACVVVDGWSVRPGSCGYRLEVGV